MAELSNRVELESKLQGRLEKAFRSHRQQLLRLLGDPPDVTRVPADFWARVEKDTEAAAAEVLLLVFFQSEELHGFTGSDARDSAERYAALRAPTLGRLVAQHSRERLADAGSRWGDRVRRELEIDDREELVRSVFGPDRAAGIAKTETVIGQNEGGDLGIRLGDIVATKFWRHSKFSPPGHAGAARRPCPVCTPRLDKPESEWGGFQPGWAHPYCDCFVSYVDNATGKPIGEG